LHPSARRGTADFADDLALVESRTQKLKLATFDKRLLKSAGTEAP
jgi:predicted nucleic-acid-binding protein